MHSEQDDEEGRDQEDSEDSERTDELDEQAARTGTAADTEFFEAQFGQPEEADRTGEPAGAADSSRQQRGRDSERRPGRRDGRRDGRRGRSERSDRTDRPRNTGGSGERSGLFGHN